MFQLVTFHYERFILMHYCKVVEILYGHTEMHRNTGIETCNGV